MKGMKELKTLLQPNDVAMYVNINGKLFGVRISLNDLKPYKERKDLQRDGLKKHFKKKIKAGYINFTNPNDYAKGLSIEEGLKRLTNMGLRTIEKGLAEVRK